MTSTIWTRTTALATLAQVSAGELTAANAMQQTQTAIAQYDPAIGAFSCLAGAGLAVDEAAHAAGPLAGLPVAVKDIFDTRELPTAYGSPLYAGLAPPRSDAAIVGVIRSAGGVVVGKTTTTEFAYLEPTATRNPNAPGRTPGGSSAGSAAAVAAGLVPWAIGTQTGGSTIRPASYCGIVGFKPSFGLLPTAGLKCFSWSLDTVGLFARDIGDVAWLAQALSGQPLALAALPEPRHWTVGVPAAYPWGGVSPSAAAAMAQGIEAWRRAGATIRTVELPPMAEALFHAHAAVQGWEAWRSLAGDIDRASGHPQGISSQLRNYLDEARRVDDATYAAAQATARHARARFADWLAPCDLLLTPSAPDEAPDGFTNTGPSTYNRAWTLLGSPCVSVPGTAGVNGYPMGLQLIGSPGEDGLLLKAAAALQKALAMAADGTAGHLPITT